MAIEHNSVYRNLILRACFCCDSRFCLHEMDQKLNLMEPLVMVTRTWTFYIVISNYLDFMQNRMMLLEQCGHIVAKVQASNA